MTTRNMYWCNNTLPTNTPSLYSRYAELSLHPLVSQILWQRGICDIDSARGFLYPEHYHPAPPGTLPDLESGASLLWKAITAHLTILVWGDFDVDGQTATALLIDGLTTLDARVSYYVPDRLTESHGIQIDRLKQLIEARQPDILLTCDTGITAHDAIAFAGQQGLQVVVTDHHDLPDDGILPAANANINPKRLPPNHQLRGLPGVGVAFLLMQMLYSIAGRDDKELDTLLDLVALGIVADVAEQKHDTRYFLQLGMDVLRNTQRPGLKAIYDVANINAEHITTETIGFQIGPRLNAVGRLGNANHAVQLLTTHDATEAQVLASQFDGLNKQRRVLQRDTLSAAKSILDTNPQLLDFTALVLYKPDWHPGLIGIVAGQLAEQYQRPCILLTSKPGDEVARGSARSALGFDIGAAIAAHADLLITHGGHPGAAGLSLPINAIDRFRRKISSTLQSQDAGDRQPVLEIDAEISLRDVTEEIAGALDILAPFGEGNPPVTLVARNLTLADQNVIGRDRLHRRLTVVSEDGTTRQVLWWNGMEHRLPEGQFDLAFNLGWNTYQERRDLAITLRDLHQSQAAPLAPVTTSPLQFEDWRTLSPAKIQTAIREIETDYLVWAEGRHADKDQNLGKKRNELSATQTLVIYTAPPSRAVLNDVLERVQPETVYIVADQPDAFTLQDFVNRLQRLCNFTISKLQGQIDLDRIAGAMAVTRSGIVWGLKLLAAHGRIDLREEKDRITISRPRTTPPSNDADDIQSALVSELQEISSYRRAFSRMPLDLITD